MKPFSGDSQIMVVVVFGLLQVVFRIINNFTHCYFYAQDFIYALVKYISFGFFDLDTMISKDLRVRCNNGSKNRTPDDTYNGKILYELLLCRCGNNHCSKSF